MNQPASSGADRTLTEWYVQASPSPELSYTIEVLAGLAEGFGYDVDDAAFLSLRELELPYTFIHDLRPIALFEKLERLDLSNNYIEDLSPLRRLTNLKLLNLETNLVVEVSPLGGLSNLVWLDLSANLVIDAAPLKTLAKLRYLNLVENPVDLDALAGLSKFAIRTTEGFKVPFETWVEYYFDRPTGEQPWYYRIDEEPNWMYGLSPATTIHYITQLFENADEILAPFSNAQVRAGLDCITNVSGSAELHHLGDETIPLADRQRCVHSIFDLFQKCFAKRCSAGSYRLSQGSSNPLDLICYCWWDIFPAIRGAELRPDIREVRQKILSLSSVICRESMESEDYCY